jgi:hypothetical protein
MTEKETPELLGRVRTELDRAADGDDAARLRTLEELYRSLEGELEGDTDQAESSRR